MKKKDEGEQQCRDWARILRQRIKINCQKENFKDFQVTKSNKSK